MQLTIAVFSMCMVSRIRKIDTNASRFSPAQISRQKQCSPIWTMINLVPRVLSLSRESTLVRAGHVFARF